MIIDDFVLFSLQRSRSSRTARRDSSDNYFDPIDFLCISGAPVRTAVSYVVSGRVSGPFGR
jgi:hypothetical protein